MNPLEYRAQSTSSRNKQQGVALVIALILLVVMTLLGISTVKTVTQQEKMSAQSHDRSLAYQYAEAALREGEQQARIQAQAANAAFPTDQYLMDGICSAAAVNKCVNGLCSTPDPDCNPRWQDANFNNANWTDYAGLGAVLSQVGNILIGDAGVSQPEYFIEILRPVGAAACVPPPALAFDIACNQKFPNPDNTNVCGTCPPGPGQQCCSYYRYRVTARVQMAGRSTVMLQSVFSVEPN